MVSSKEWERFAAQAELASKARRLKEHERKARRRLIRWYVVGITMTVFGMAVAMAFINLIFPHW